MLARLRWLEVIEGQGGHFGLAATAMIARLRWLEGQVAPPASRPLAGRWPGSELLIQPPSTATASYHFFTSTPAMSSTKRRIPE